MTRAQRAALLITLLILALVVLAGRGRMGTSPGSVLTERYAAPLGESKRLQATISQGAGTLRVETIDNDNAYEASLRHSAAVRVEVRYRSGDLRISDQRLSIRGGNYANDWVIGISRRVPSELRVSAGAGRSTLDLTGLSGQAQVRAGAGEVTVEFRDGQGALDELTLQAGAGRFEAVGLGNAHARRIEAGAGVGEFRLDLSGSARDLTEVEIKGGVGRIVIMVPADLGVRIQARRGVTSRLTLPGFTQRAEDDYVNAAWDTAPAKVEIRASLGVGELEVRGR